MTRIIALIGGKGGVGKTTLTSNLATALAELGQQVVAVDANLTTANLGLHLGMHMAPKTLHDVLSNKSKLKDSTYPHALGFKVIPGSMSINDLESVDVGKMPEVSLNLIGTADFVLYDCAAGLGREAVSALSAANEVFIIANPNIPSMVDALKTVKVAQGMNKRVSGVIVNRVKNSSHEMTRNEIEEMLGLPVLAEIPEDNNVPKSIASKRPVVDYDPHSPASVEIRRLAHNLSGKTFRYMKPPNLRILERLVGWMTG